MSPPLPKQDGATTSPLVVSLQKTCQSQVLSAFTSRLAFGRKTKEGAGPP
jgi:hypothetical protein